jgi:hypothetical protein
VHLLEAGADCKLSKQGQLCEGAAVTVGSVLKAGKDFSVIDVFKGCGAGKELLAQKHKTLSDCLQVTILWPQLAVAKVRQRKRKGASKAAAKARLRVKPRRAPRKGEVERVRDAARTAQLQCVCVSWAKSGRNLLQNFARFWTSSLTPLRTCQSPCQQGFRHAAGHTLGHTSHQITPWSHGVTRHGIL